MIILTGNGAAQAVNLLSYPLLGRLYSPEAFGVFAMFVAASAIPGGIACARFDLVVPIAPKHGRYAVLWLCTFSSAAAGLLSIGGAALYWHLTGRHVGPVLPVLLGMTVMLTGLCNALSMFAMRHDRYRTQSVSVLVRSLSSSIVQVGLGFVAATSFSLILGFVLGLLMQAAVLTVATWMHLAPKWPRMREMRAMFYRFRPQVFMDIPSALLSGFSLNMLTLLLAAIYDQRTVGFYSVGYRLAVVPLQIFNDALSQTYFQKAARARETKGHFWDEMKFGFATSGLLSLAIVGGIVLFARPFITLYMGPAWGPSATMLIILAPMIAVSNVVQSIATTVFIIRKTHWRLIHTSVLVLLHLVAFAIARALQLSVNQYLGVVSGFFVLAWGVYAAVLMRASRRHFHATLSTDALAAVSTRQPLP